MAIKRYDRERILVKKDTIDLEQFDNKTLKEFINYFNDLRESYRNEFPNIEPTLTIYHYGYDGGSDLLVNIYDKESDEVYRARVAKLEYNNKIAEEKTLEKERKVYELLKKKFGD